MTAKGSLLKSQLLDDVTNPREDWSGIPDRLHGSTPHQCDVMGLVVVFTLQRIDSSKSVPYPSPNPSWNILPLYVVNWYSPCTRSGTRRRCTRTVMPTVLPTDSQAWRFPAVRQCRRLQQVKRFVQMEKASLCRWRAFSRSTHRGGEPPLHCRALWSETSTVRNRAAASKPADPRILNMWLHMCMADDVCHDAS